MVAEKPETSERPVALKPRHDIFTRRKIRNLYLFQDRPHAEIARECGMTVQSVKSLVHSAGWTEEKRDRIKRLRTLERERESTIDPDFIEAVASQGEQHLLRSLEKTGEALERSDINAARDSQAYSATAKNLVGIVKALRDPGSEAVAAGPLTMNLFFSAPVAQVSEPKTVIPIEPS